MYDKAMPVQPGGSRALLTLEENRGFQLFARCPRCEHEGELNHAAIAESLGWDVLIADVYKRLRCGVCR